MTFTARLIHTGEFEQAKRVWDIVFPEDAPRFSDYYFAHRTRPEYVLGAFDNGRMAGSLHMVPYPMQFYGVEKPCCMVAGVSTLPEYRHQGVATLLLKRSNELMRERGYVAALLKPDVDFYGPFGYRPFSVHDAYQADASGFDCPPAGALHTPDAAEVFMLYRAFTGGYSASMLRDEAYCSYLLLELQTYDAVAYATEGAYALCMPSASGAIVLEVAGSDMAPLLAALAQRYGRLAFRLPHGYVDHRIKARGEPAVFSMIHVLDEAALISGTGVPDASAILEGSGRGNVTLEFC